MGQPYGLLLLIFVLLSVAAPKLSVSAGEINVQLLGELSVSSRASLRPGEEPPRWRVTRIGDAVAHTGFDPALHTPNFPNSIAYWLKGRSKPAEPSYLVCFGMSLVTHCYYRSLTMQRRVGRANSDAMKACFFSDAVFPPTVTDLNNLRGFCKSATTAAGGGSRRVALSEMIATVQEDTPSNIVSGSAFKPTNAERSYLRIVSEIKNFGSACLHYTYLNPSENMKRHGGHNILAYGVYEGRATSGSREVDVKVIPFWDPSSNNSAESRTAAARRERNCLIYDPARKTMTLTEEHLSKNGPDKKARASDMLQPGEFLQFPRDIYHHVLDERRVAAVLNLAAQRRYATDAADYVTY
jgi:hypothetical protein